MAGRFAGKALLGCGVALLSLSPLGAGGAWAESEEGEAIIVKGQLVAAADAPWSISQIDHEEIRKEAAPQFDQLLRFVPGMAVRDFGMGGVANGIVIRGFGNGGHGGDLGAIIDGIPLNEAMSHDDGYVDLNVLVPLEVQNLSVFRGPVSALYGNYNRGGLLRVETRKGGDYVEIDAGLGAFATADMQVAMGRTWEGGRLNLAGQYYLTDGWRPHSDQARQTVSGRLALDLAPGIELALSGRYHHADANSASYMTLEQFQTDPQGQDPDAQNDGAKKHFGTLRADLSTALSADMALVTFAYGTKQDFTRWFSRPVSSGGWRQREETYDRSVFGAGTSLNGQWANGLTYKPVTYAMGAEVFRERTDYLYFDGLDHRRRINAALNDRRTRLNSVSGFAEVQAPLHRLFDLSLGVRADRFTGRCTPNGQENGDDPCGKLNTTSRLSPKLGARSQVFDGVQLRASWAEGFALPNAFVKYAVGGQALDANLFRQTEIGVKLEPVQGLSFDVSAFRLVSSQEVRTVMAGVYENYGRTRRKGVEASFDWDVRANLALRSVYGYTKTQVVENADTGLIGNAVAGVPKHTANVQVDWSPVQGWSLGGNWRYVGAYAIDAANLHSAKSYDLFDMTLAYEGTAPFAYRAYLRVDNLLDRDYATTASRIAGKTVVAPGAPRALRAGVQVSL